MKHIVYDMAYLADEVLCHALPHVAESDKADFVRRMALRGSWTEKISNFYYVVKFLKRSHIIDLQLHTGTVLEC